MELVWGLAAALVLVLALLAILFLRRLVIARGGGVEVGMRIYRMRQGRGWSLGFARFSGDKFLWYRTFSLAFRPRTILSRHHLVVRLRREPSTAEGVALMQDSVVLECVAGERPVELAISAAALTGFLSWLEASAPGGSFHS
jgi:hypothetical protein